MKLSMRSRLLVLVITFFGCARMDYSTSSNSKAGHSAGSGASSPQALLERLHFALIKGDHSEFARCYMHSEQHKRFLDSVCDVVSSQYEFTDRIEKSYGSDGLAYFSNIRTAKPGMIIMCRLRAGWWESANIRLDKGGKQATYDDWYLGQQGHMNFFNGAWHICLSSKDYTDWDIDVNTIMCNVNRTCMAYIGKPGVTIDDIRYRLGELKRASLAKLGPQPDH